MAGWRAFTNQSRDEGGADAGDRQHANRQRRGASVALSRAARRPRSGWLVADRPPRGQGRGATGRRAPAAAPRRSPRSRPRARRPACAARGRTTGSPSPTTDSSMSDDDRARALGRERLGAVLPARRRRRRGRAPAAGWPGSSRPARPARRPTSPRESEDADEQLGQVAERRLHHAGRAGAEPVAELLDRRPTRLREQGERHRRHQERHHRREADHACGPGQRGDHRAAADQPHVAAGEPPGPGLARGRGRDLDKAHGTAG